MESEEKTVEARVAGIYEDGILIIISGKQFYVSLDKYDEFHMASNKDMFDMVCDNYMVKWPALGIEIKLDDIKVAVPELLFAYPKINQYVLITVIIIGTVMVGLAGTAAIFKKTASDQLIYAWAMFVIFSIADVYLLFCYSVIRQSIYVDDNGISEVAPNGKRTTIQWSDIIKIKECKLENDIKILSKENKAIRINQLINGLGDIMYIIRSKTGLEIE